MGIWLRQPMERSGQPLVPGFTVSMALIENGWIEAGKMLSEWVASSSSPKARPWFVIRDAVPMREIWNYVLNLFSQSVSGS